MTISAVLAVRDEAAMIEGALRSVAFCDERIVVIDDRSSDATEELARRHTEHVLRMPFTGFGALKNAGVEHATGDWIVFCDGDERVTPRLAREFEAELARDTSQWAFRSPTVNFFWGRRMEHGGWRESHIKIVRRDHALHRGDIHEVLDIPEDRVGWLDGERWHFSHRSIEDNLRKTILYGQLDADERLAAGAPRVTLLTFLKVLGLEFGRRMIRRGGWRDGVPGVIEGLYQPFALFCVSVMLWERQRGDRIAERYAELDRLVERQV
jgi:glycosyltransferase involved in cell wall biosynthesis